MDDHIHCKTCGGVLNDQENKQHDINGIRLCDRCMENEIIAIIRKARRKKLRSKLSIVIRGVRISL